MRNSTFHRDDAVEGGSRTHDRYGYLSAAYVCYLPTHFVSSARRDKPHKQTTTVNKQQHHKKYRDITMASLRSFATRIHQTVSRTAVASWKSTFQPAAPTNLFWQATRTFASKKVRQAKSNPIHVRSTSRTGDMQSNYGSCGADAIQM
jgi:hypothetical protein